MKINQSQLHDELWHVFHRFNLMSDENKGSVRVSKIKDLLGHVEKLAQYVQNVESIGVKLGDAVRLDDGRIGLVKILELSESGYEKIEVVFPDNRTTSVKIKDVKVLK